MKLRTLFAAIAALFVTSAAMADINNLESYLFRFDFSKGQNEFSSSSDYTGFNIVGKSTASVNGPNGASSAATLTANSWKAFTSNSVLNEDGWTIATSLSPANINNACVFSVGRLTSTSSGAKKSLAICTTEAKDRLLVRFVYRTSSGYSCTEKTMTGLGDITKEFHALVIKYEYTDNGSGNKGTLTFYWDGEKKLTHKFANSTPFGTSSSIGGIQFNNLTSQGAGTYGGKDFVNATSVHSFYDFRFYKGVFSDADATAYAALYPTDRMGSPFRPSAYIEASATNTAANATVGNYIDTGYLAKGATTRFVADFQFLDVRGQQRIFGTYGNFVQGLYINGSAASGGKLAWNFMGTKKWVSMDVGAGRIRRIATFDRVGKTIAVTNFADRAQFYYNNDLAELLADTPNASTNTYLFAENNSGAKNYGKARIYSFEADESGTPVLFLAPDTENGEAGFRNIIDGTFHGDGNKDNNPERTLRFYNGVGCASDYKYENDTLYAKLYATSGENGAVSVAGGAAASSAEGWIPHGGTLALTAVPDAEYYGIDRWEGDTWAIASGTTTSTNITVQSDTAIQLRAVFRRVRVATPALGEGVPVVFSNSTTLALSCAIEGASLYYTLDGTTPTTSSTFYERPFIFSPTTTKTTLKVIAVKENWLDSDVFEVALVNLAAVPLTAYAQSGSEDMLLHLDAIENAGAGAHETAPSTWTNLVEGGITLSKTGTATFGVDAWNPNGSSYFIGSSDAMKTALTGDNAALTVELVISHPSTQNGYEYWLYHGSGSSRNLIVDLRSDNSKNPLVQGVQYRATNWVGSASIAQGTKTAWNKRTYIAVVCDGTTATTYCDGNVQLHSVTGTHTPTSNRLGIGSSPTGTLPLSSGAEICAVRVTKKVLTEDERMHNFYVDGLRFGLDGAPTAGYRIANGKVQVCISNGVEGYKLSTDGGETWAEGEVWVDIDAEVTLSASFTENPELSISFSGQPGDAIKSGNSITFTPTKPCAIIVSAAQWTNNNGTGSFDDLANWAGGILPLEGNFTVNISNDTVITVNGTHSLGDMSVKGTGSVTFTGTGSISATMLNVASGLTVDTSGKLIVSGFAGEGNVVLTPASDTLTLSSASELTGDLTIKAGSSVAFNVNATTSVSNFYVNAATDAVVTMSAGSDGSFIATSEVAVQHGVLKQGSDNVLGATPKVTVEDGGTFDVNNLLTDRRTVFSIAGAGAGNWPWVLTSSANMGESRTAICIVNLASNATIGADCQMCIGIRYGDSFNLTTGTKSLTLNGYTLTKTGTGNLWLRRPYSTNEGTIDIQAGTLRMNDWSGGNQTYGNSCVNNITLIAREGTTVKNEMDDSDNTPIYTLYFKSLDLRGATVTSTGGTFGALETLSGHVSLAKLEFAAGATAVLDGNLTVSGAMTAVGDLSLTRAADVETNVTVAATGTLIATNAINVGAGVIFNIGTNRMEGTFIVDNDAMLALRQVSIDEEEIVLNASASIQQQNIVLYDINGVELQDHSVNYDEDAGTVTVRAPTPVWSNADGTGSFSAAENWSSGAMPGQGRSFIMSLDGDTTVWLDSEYVRGDVQMTGSGSVSFEGEGSLTLGKLLLTNNVSFATCGRVTVARLDLPTGSSAMLTTLNGIAAGGVTGVGTLALVLGEVESVTIGCLSAFAGDFSVAAERSMTCTLTCEATSLKKFTLKGVANAVFTLKNGTGGLFEASEEVIVAGGVLKLGGDNVLGKTSKVTVNDGGTFDVNGKLVGDGEAVDENVVTEFHIAGAGAGSYPWSLTSSANMTSDQNVCKLYLDADATIGGSKTLWLGVRYGAGWSSANKNLNLGGHTLTKTGSGNLNIRRPYSGTGGGTLAIAEGTCTFSAWSKGTDAYGKSCVSNLDLVVASGATVVNDSNEKPMLFYFNSIELDGSTVDTNAQSDAEGFGVLKTLSGYGMIAKLTMDAGAVFKPDGEHYLNVTNSLSGKLTVDISDPAVAGKAKIPLLKVPTALKDTADSALDLSALPPGWELLSNADGTNVEYWLKHKGFTIFMR